MLAIAGGGTRRPELISEAEARGAAGDNELDFDSQVFEGFAPSEGAPGPEQAPLWEDVEQPEADVAAALQMELAELRALRTPVPTRPSGMASVHGDAPVEAHEPHEPEPHELHEPAPPRSERPRTAELDGDGDGDGAPETPQMTEPRPARPPTAPVASLPQIGGTMLARRGSSRVPWAIAGVLAMAVVALVAYIVLRLR
jgi:hypothetical protein